MSALLHEEMDWFDVDRVKHYLGSLDAHALAALRHGHHIGYLLFIFSANIRGPSPSTDFFMELSIEIADVLIAHGLGTVGQADIAKMMEHPRLAIAILRKSTQYELATCVEGMRDYFFDNTFPSTKPSDLEVMLHNYKAVFTVVIEVWKKRNKPNNYFEDCELFEELTETPPADTEEPELSMYEIEKEVVEDRVRSRARLFAARLPLLDLNEGLELHRLSNHKAHHDVARRKDDHVINYLRAEHNQREIASYIDQEPIARKKKNLSTKGKKHSGGTKRKKVRK